MKRLAAFTGFLALALVVAGCGDKKNESDSKDQQASNDAAGGMPAGGMPETPDGGMPGGGMHDGGDMPGDYGGAAAPPGYPVADDDGGMPPGEYPGDYPGGMPPGGGGYPMPPEGYPGAGGGYPGAPGGAAAGGDPKQQYEAILKGYVASLNHMAEALETIEDKESVPAAAETINVSSDELVELKRQASSIRLPDAEKRELDTRYDPQLREAARRILSASEQAGQYAAGEKAYFDALLRMTAARDVQQGKKPPASYMGSGAQVAGGGNGRMPPGGYPMGFDEGDMPPGGFPGDVSPEVGSATAPGFPGGFPGAPGEGPGAASQVPSFPEGSAKSAVVQFCVGIRDNKISDLGEIISPKATGTLEELRSSKVSDAKLKELQALLGHVWFAGERQEPDGSPVLYVQNAQRQRVKFKCEREGKIYVIRDMDQIETPRRPVRPVRRRPY